MRILLIVLGILIMGADQLLKNWVTLNLSFGDADTLVPGLLSLTKVYNSGAAWSMLEGKTWFFYLVGAIALVILIPLLVQAYRKKTSLIYFTGLVLIIAGAVGNLIDRVMQGYVVDMFQLDFINFPIFNIADFSLTIGVVLLFIFVIFLDKDEDVAK
ncbi:signal peptidase II [Lapidilactobacillus mulanensis]|uniref:Lipoprotein signal peptidase n=1 Tax=Lapidilactobacillus mulanensis TaxID=2485999 RepID=A0ABW4DST7_9LACO|nr:signal peptidase II [Lapidilactobacillus mulanensis]